MVFDPSKIMTQTPEEAPLVMVFSLNGYGKSSFIASARNPFVIDAEQKFKTEKQASIYRPENLDDITGVLNFLLNQEKLENGIIAIDTLDWIEQQIHNAILKENPGASNIIDDKIKELNFQKGYLVAANRFLGVIYPLLDAIRKKHHMPIVIGAQCAEIKQDDADKDTSYKMKDLRVQEKLADLVSDLMEAKVYLNKREHVVKKGEVIPTEERFLVTRRVKGINAKNNLHLPAEIPISYSNGWNDFVDKIGTCPPTN